MNEASDIPSLEERLQAWKNNHTYEQKYKSVGRAPEGEYEIKLEADNGDTLRYRKTNTNPHDDEKLTSIQAVDTIDDT